MERKDVINTLFSASIAMR